MSPEAFNEWGWRIPFLLSVFLLLISIWIRLQLNESPVFLKMKEEMATSKAPLSEAFGKWSNLKYVFIALFGCVAGQAVICTRHVLRPQLPEADAARGCGAGRHAGGHFAALRHAASTSSSAAVGPHRTPVSHSRRSADPGFHVLPAVSYDDSGGEPGALRRRRHVAGDRARRSGRVRCSSIP